MRTVARMQAVATWLRSLRATDCWPDERSGGGAASVVTVIG